MMAFSPSLAQQAAPTPEHHGSREQTDASIEKAMQFLLADQNKDGSWGGPRAAIWTFTGDVWSNPETHRSWKVATTGLCALALLKVGQGEEAQAALDRSLDYLLEEAVVYRPSDWDTMNSWAYIYGLQALAEAYGDPRYADSPKRPKMKEVGEKLASRLSDYQSVSGGWGYLEFDEPRTVRPQWGTSFSTAAGVVALQAAKSQGFTVDQGTIDRAVRAVQHCKLPNGAYTYSINTISDPRGLEWIDQVKGSLCRIQVCNIAQVMSGVELPQEELRQGLDWLFEHHRFLDIARNKPIPHENFYLNSGYFYLFGHYYAALIVKRLPKEEQAEYWSRLRHEVIKIQQADGSMWDYDMHAYHKPYGTAFSLLTLGESVSD